MKLMDLYEAGVNAKQNATMEKMAKFGWRFEYCIINDKHPNEVGAVMKAEGNVAILYPDGTMDRMQGAQKSLKFRDGWYDAEKQARANERQRAAMELFKHLYQQLLGRQR